MASLPRADRPISFTDLERELLALIPEDGSKITTTDLVISLYGEGPGPHLAPGPNVIARLKSIALKAERMQLPWRLSKSARRGPQPSEFWRTRVGVPLEPELQAELGHHGPKARDFT